MKKKVIYVSGKISGMDEKEARAKFKVGEDIVREMGAEPINPFDILEQSDELQWIDYMRADIKALVDCDGILMLDNWKDSDGAKLELLIAQGLKMEIYYI